MDGKFWGHTARPPCALQHDESPPSHGMMLHTSPSKHRAKLSNGAASPSSHGHAAAGKPGGLGRRGGGGGGVGGGDGGGLGGSAGGGGGGGAGGGDGGGGDGGGGDGGGDGGGGSAGGSGDCTHWFEKRRRPSPPMAPW